MMRDKFEAEVKIKEDQIADLQEALKTQHAEIDKAKQELTSALSTAERLKEGFKKERADWATEKAGLTKRAENAEAALKPVVDELTAVQRQIHSMTAAIFGTRIGHLGNDVRKKLKAAYTLVEQLYTGAQRIIATASYNNPAPSLIQDTLSKLSMLPARIEELKKIRCPNRSHQCLNQGKGMGARL